MTMRTERKQLHSIQFESPDGENAQGGHFYEQYLPTSDSSFP